jgi:hypothetical protein
MSLLEVIGVALAGVEVAAAELRHFSPHQTEAQRCLEAEPRHGEGRPTSVTTV